MDKTIVEHDKERNEAGGHNPHRPGQQQRTEFLFQSSVHYTYFKVATNTSSKVKASEVKDSGCRARSCSMICGPPPLSTTSTSRPLRRTWTAPANSTAGASSAKPARTF